jgi:hypothetical protein
MANFLKSLFVKGVEIDTASATAGKVLTYDGTKFAPATPGSGSLALDDLSDVVITTPATTQFVRYNGTNWVNTTISAGDVPTLNQNTTGSAAVWTTSRTITLAGDLTGNVLINGSADVTLTATVAANSVALGTDTTGNYMSGISGTSPVSVAHTAGEGSSATVSLAASYGDTQNPYASKTANYVLAAPNGSSGAPTFRAIVAADIPTLPNSATTATSANTSSAIVARDASGNFTAGTITAALTGTASGNLVSGGALGTPSSGTLTNCTFPTLNQSTTGSAATLTTARTLWGQSFNGSAAISGSLTGVGDINTAASPISTIYASNWFRSTGTSGWYNESYGGGTFMQDTTFVRIYNSKIFYATGGIWSVDGGTASTSGYNYLLRGGTYGNYAPFTSTRDVKRNIQPLVDSGSMIDQLNPVTFQEKITEQDDEISTAWKDADLEYGFIAEEVAEVAAGHLAQYKGMPDGTLKPVGWSFHGVVSVLVAEVKELRKRIAQLELTQQGENNG